MQFQTVIPQDLRTTASPTFAALNIGTGIDIYTDDGVDDMKIDVGSTTILEVEDSALIKLGNQSGSYFKIDTEFYFNESVNITDNLVVDGMVAFGNSASISSKIGLFQYHSFTSENPTGFHAGYASVIDWDASGTGSANAYSFFCNLNFHQNAGTHSLVDGDSIRAFISAKWNSGDITDCAIFRGKTDFTTGHTGTFSVVTGLKLEGMDTTISGGGIVSKYGIYIDDVSNATTDNYSIYTNLGNVSFGDNLVLRNDNDKIQIGADEALEIYHNGTDSYIDNFSGGLILSDSGTTRIEIDSTGIGFFGLNPIAQQTTSVTEAAFTENSGGTVVNVDSTFGGYTLQQVVQALINYGLLA